MPRCGPGKPAKAAINSDPGNHAALVSGGINRPSRLARRIAPDSPARDDQRIASGSMSIIVRLS